MELKFFASPARFRQWLERNHDKKSELWVGFHKKLSGKKSITYPEAVDEALCYGWIDGVRKTIDANSYMTRFSPRRPKSIWSRINIMRVGELKKMDRMMPAGLKAFETRDPEHSGRYSFENAPREFVDQYQERFRKKRKAWEYFQAQPPGYKKMAIFWVMSAKKEETRLRRLDQLIDASLQGVRIGIVTGKGQQTKAL